MLVTGIPRSGTTWLARRLAESPHTSMPGREPMNPRGRQFALGGALSSWVRRVEFAPAEAAVLRRCYAGREPRAFSRYGIRQWAAPLPSTQVVIKDPFALLSLRAIHDVTGATPVLLYRHPAAVLASYRRMGWTADTAELGDLGAPAPKGEGDVEAMIAMWRWCHEIALDDLDKVDGAVIVSHRALTLGGYAAHARLCRELKLPPPAPGSLTAAAGEHDRREGALHDFERTAAEVESGWRERLDPAEIAHVEEAVDAIWHELEARQLALPAPTLGAKDELT